MSYMQGIGEPNRFSNQQNNGLPQVNDPKQALADITYSQYMDYKKNFTAFENEQIERATNDTSLIDQGVSAAVTTKIVISIRKPVNPCSARADATYWPKIWAARVNQRSVECAYGAAGTKSGAVIRPY